MKLPKIIIIIAVAMTTIAVIVTVIVIVTIFLSYAKEEKLWDEITKRPTIENCQAYLDEYPNGKHRFMVADYKEEICEDEEAWGMAIQSSSTYLYTEYLEQHPEGLHANQAKSILDSLLWENAIDENSIFAFENYLSQSPLCSHSEEANRILSEIKDRTLSEQESIKAKSAVRKFFMAISSRNADMLMSTIQSSLKFFGKQSNKNAVLSYMNRKYASDVFKINISIEEMTVNKAKVDNSNYFYVKFVINWHTEREDISKETYSNNEGVAIVNKDGKIISFTMYKTAGY